MEKIVKHKKRFAIIAPALGIKVQLLHQLVYGIAFSADNRVVLRIEDGKYKLTGGKPENAEFFEEILITGGIN